MKITEEYVNYLETLPMEDLLVITKDFTPEEKIQITAILDKIGMGDTINFWTIDLIYFTITLSLYKKAKFKFSHAFEFNLHSIMVDFLWFGVDMLQQPKAELK